MKLMSYRVLLGCLSVALIAGPSSTYAQMTNKVVAEKKATSISSDSSTSGHKQTNGPFRGHLAAVDRAGKTITVGKRTFHITSQTKILRAGKPATLESAVLGEETSGGFKTAENGNLVATKVNLGPKMETGGVSKK